MCIVVFGAGGPTGRQLIDQALAARHTATACTTASTTDVYNVPVASALAQAFLAEPIWHADQPSPAGTAARRRRRAGGSGPAGGRRASDLRAQALHLGSAELAGC
jgi:hypothetical protein